MKDHWVDERLFKPEVIYPKVVVMNIDDVKPEEVPAYDPERFMVNIFARQFQHAKRYSEIEARNGFWSPPMHGDIEPVIIMAIDDARFQAWTKDMLWRVTEEIAEALEDWPAQGFSNWRDRYADDHVVRHVLEELADATHFLAEVSLFHGLNPVVINSFWAAFGEWKFKEDETDMTDNKLNVYAWAMRPIRAMGLAANCLKNKPWKLSQMPTDRAKFVRLLHSTWDEFAALWRFVRCNREDVHNLYFKKTVVNAFRQDSNY